MTAVGATAAPGRDGGSRPASWTWLLLPVGLFLAAEVVTLLVAALDGHPALGTSTWDQHDAGYYLAIADRGYFLLPCSGPDGPVGQVCGDAAWFPGLPWLTAALVALGAPAGSAMLALARLFTLGTLVVAWVGLLDRRRDGRAIAALVLVAFAPGAVYFHALFPMSMATCFVVLAVACGRHGRFGWAGAAGLVAATAYPIVVLLAPVMGAWALLATTGARGTRLRTAAPAAVGPVLGAALVWAVMWRQTGAWDAFRMVQAHYEYQVGEPLSMLRAELSGLRGGGQALVIALQEVLVTGLVLTCVAWVALTRARGAPLVVVTLAVIWWLVPLVLHQLSLYRADTLLLVLALVVARLPRPLAYAAAGAAVVLAPLLTLHFVRGTLI